MKVSVIVISYNTEKYLKKCIDSILNQTLSDIEIIIADDASTDNTPDIALRLSEQHENILFLPLTTRKGPGGARNEALKSARGKYVAFVDSDDWVDLSYFEVMYEKAEKLNLDIAACGLIREYDYKISEPVYKCKYDREYVFNGEIAFRIMTNEYNCGIKFLPSALNKIYRRDFLKNNSLHFPEDLLFEDQPFSYSCTLAADRVGCIPGILYHHYKRRGSIVQSFDKRNIDDMMAAYRMIRTYLYDNNIYEKYRFNYYSSLQHFYNLIIRQIFEYVTDENLKKEFIKYSLSGIKSVIDIDEYIEYLSAEELRKHIQPNITDTTIY
ncbi:MAG: glycosyltransferase [Clostridiales bacterium]|nr:glycosyltransferase [Clostridiales bacterium]